jgi:hypothetical protein
VFKVPVLWLPPVAFAPLQPPDAVQDVALVELQVSVEDPPLAIVVGFAVRIAVGTGLVVIVTAAAKAALVPPEPVQVIEYVVSVVKAPVLWVPLVANAPLQPPDAVHDVALVELQVNVEDSPLVTAVGAAAIDAVAGGGAVTTGTDPDPPQAARSSAAPVVITGAKQRIRVFSDSRNMSAAGLCSNLVRTKATTANRWRIHAPHQASSLSRPFIT